MNWEIGAAIVGAISVLYGLVIAFAMGSWSPPRKKNFVLGGAVVIILLAVALILLPLMGVY